MIKNFVVMGVTISGTVTKSDYDEFTPQVEAIVKASGSIRMLMDITGLIGEKSEAWKSDWDFGQQFKGRLKNWPWLAPRAGSPR